MFPAPLFARILNPIRTDVKRVQPYANGLCLGPSSKKYIGSSSPFLESALTTHSKESLAGPITDGRDRLQRVEAV
jgi:hypothetical protein